MDLLPKTTKQFESAEYWENFFKRRGSKAFEWYGEYTELCGLLAKYVKTRDKILMLGCGNSQLSADMYDVGHHNITNIDISNVVIKQMKSKNARKREKMQFLRMDILQMSLEDDSFSVILDKGTLDAMMTDDSDLTQANVEKMFDEVSRVLRFNGRYICISLCQEYIVKKILQYFPTKGWMTRLHRITDIENPGEFKWPVFMWVLTKFKQTPGCEPRLEISAVPEAVQKVDTIGDVAAMIVDQRCYAVLQKHLMDDCKMTECRMCQAVQQEGIALNLFSTTSGIKAPRYSLYVVDSNHQNPELIFGVFIVPPGRETEWMFSTVEGRRKLVETTGFQRLVVAHLNREHTYDNMEIVKSELSCKVMELAQPSVTNSRYQAPFLTIQEEIGDRKVIYKCESKMSGDFVVEDVVIGQDTFRALIFLGNQAVRQSEARLLPINLVEDGEKIEPSQRAIDHKYLSSKYFLHIIAGMAYVGDFQIESPIDISLIGLGGGGLPMYLHSFLPKVNIESVELDPLIYEVAKKWFDFKDDDDRLTVKIADGLDYLNDLIKEDIKKHVIIFDIDNKDSKLGMSCPPAAFVGTSVLQDVHNILYPQGVFMLNLVCRMEALRDKVVQDLRDVFSFVFSLHEDQHLNEIWFCLKRKPDAHLKNQVETALEQISKAMRQKGCHHVDDEKLAGALASLSLNNYLGPIRYYSDSVENTETGEANNIIHE